MNPADYSALDETLDLMAPMGPDLANGFSNHAPMAIEAMCAMRRADAVMPWFEGYRASLAPRRARVARLTDENWRAALGDQRRTEDWFEFFRNEIEERPWTEVLDTWAARLAPGLMAAATHGVIRTGHAVRALALKDNISRRRELADGLAYWAAEYMPLPAARHKSARAMPSDAIARVQMIPPETRRGNFGAFTDALATARFLSSVQGHAGRCRSRRRRIAHSSPTWPALLRASFLRTLTTLIRLSRSSTPSRDRPRSALSCRICAMRPRTPRSHTRGKRRRRCTRHSARARTSRASI